VPDGSGFVRLVTHGGRQKTLSGAARNASCQRALFSQKSSFEFKAQFREKKGLARSTRAKEPFSIQNRALNSKAQFRAEKAHPFIRAEQPFLFQIELRIQSSISREEGLTCRGGARNQA